MKLSVRSGVSAVLCCLLSGAASAAESAAVSAAVSAAPASLAEVTARMPLRFEENAGQVKDAGVRYFARGTGYRLALRAQEAVFDLGAQPGEATVRLRLGDTAERPALAGVDPLPTKSNYLHGNDPRAWHTGVASFARVRYEGVYPGTDMVFSGDGRRVEQSFFLAAGAEPRRIRLVYEGASSVEIGKAGELTVRTAGGELAADAPVAYQEIGGERRTVECRYELLAQGKAAPQVGFVLGAYDRELPLVIDPVFTNGLTRLYGSGVDVGHAVGVDGDGNVYIAGSTDSTDFIGTIGPGGVQAANGGTFDGFVAKVDPSGTTLLYSTYLGGDGVDEISGIAVDAAGNAYLTGYTFSSDFPGVTGASLQASGAGGREAFVAKLSPNGAAFIYSTYLGGNGTDFGDAVAIDASGNAYVTGSTSSSNFPGVTASAFQPANAGGASDAFVTKINAAGSAIVYSTYLGAGDEDAAYSIAVGASGNAFVTGATCSEDFPVTAGVLEPAGPGADCGNFLYDAFVAKLDTAGTALVYSTFLGGDQNDVARGVAVDSTGNAYVTGYTNSSSFTGVTGSSYQPENPGGYAAFLTRIDATAGAAGYSTFLGGGGAFAYGIALDAAANAHVTGVVEGDGSFYPLVNASTLYPVPAGFGSAGFASKIDAAGAVRYSTTLPGNSGAAYAIAVDSIRKMVFITGSRIVDNSQDAFLIRIEPTAALSITKTADVQSVDPGGKITYTLAYQNYGELNAAGATLNETVPENTVFKPAQSTAGWSCTPSDQAGSACTLALGTVTAGAGGSATFTVKVKANLSANGAAILNQACASPGPDCAFAVTPTTAAPILSITKTARFNEAKPGNVLRYTIKVFNTGNMDAAPVVVTDTVPGNAVFDPVTSTPGWSCSPDGSAGSVCSFQVANLATGAHATVDFAVTLSTLYSNTACAVVVPPTPELAGQVKGGKKALAAPPVCSTATTPLK